MFNKILIFTMVLVFSVLVIKSQVIPCKPSETAYNLPCLKQELDLADKKILIKVYTKTKLRTKIDKTFVVIHNNEQKGLDAAKKVISENYGRLVEIVSNASDDGDKKRYLYFGSNNCIDPNRIYSGKGIKATLKNRKNPCTTIDSPSVELIGKIQTFANKLLNIITLNNTHKFIIGVHNNDDSLSLNTWTNDGDEEHTAFGIFKANNHVEKEFFDTGKHNFVLATNGKLFGGLLDNGVYFVALQESRSYFTKIDEQTRKTVVKDDLDDGSMSIYFGTTLFGISGKPFDYINIEAGGKENNNDSDSNKMWQEKVIKTVIKTM